MPTDDRVQASAAGVHDRVRLVSMRPNRLHFWDTGLVRAVPVPPALETILDTLLRRQRGPRAKSFKAALAGVISKGATYVSVVQCMREWGDERVSDGVEIIYLEPDDEDMWAATVIQAPFGDELFEDLEIHPADDLSPVEKLSYLHIKKRPFECESNFELGVLAGYKSSTLRARLGEGE